MSAKDVRSEELIRREARAEALRDALESLHGYYRGKPLCEACHHAVQMIRVLIEQPGGESEHE